MLPDIKMTIAEAGSVAQDRVLSMPDLLVIILSQLPHSTLLNAQCVNRIWASVFRHREIQAALFLQPRPKESALYVEVHSDILKKMFPPFWPTYMLDEASFSRTKRFRPKNGVWKPIDDYSADMRPARQGKRLQSQLWRQLLVCQPPVKVLELVQNVSFRGGGSIEFRTTIARPDGLRMGFLYDAVRHWHQFESSRCSLLWNRKTGDRISTFSEFENDHGFWTSEGSPCLTILGSSSVGCGQRGGRTYLNRSRLSPEIIESGDEKVEYCMAKPNLEGSSARLLSLEELYLDEFDNYGSGDSQEDEGEIVD